MSLFFKQSKKVYLLEFQGQKCRRKKEEKQEGTEKEGREGKGSEGKEKEGNKKEGKRSRKNLGGCIK